MSARVVCLMVMVVALGCTSDIAEFGKPCGAGEGCSGDSARCVGGVCVPTREPGDAGDTCANALAISTQALERTAAPLVREISFAGALADYPTSCGGDATPDVVVSFSVPRNTAPFPVRIRAELAQATLSLRRLDDGTCATEVADACVADNELLFESVGEGEWAVIVSARGVAAEAVRVIVEPIDCPAGYLPFGDDACAGFREVPVLPDGRLHPRLAPLPDGRALLAGGTDARGERVWESFLFEPSAETWTYQATVARTPPHDVVVADDYVVLVGGGQRPEALLREGGEDVTLLLDVEPMAGGPGGFDSSTLQLAAGLPSGMIAIITDDSDYLLRVQREVARCFGGVCFEHEGICVQDANRPGDPGLCLCPDGPCLGPPMLAGSPETTGARAAGVASRRRAIIGSVVGSREYVTLADGATLYELDVETQHWRSMPVVARDEVALSATPAGVLVIGGRIDGVPTNLVELVEPSVQAYDTPASLRHARTDHAQTMLQDGRALVVGGRGTGEQALASAELLDLTTNTVARLPSLPMPLTGAQAVTLADGRVLVVGAPDDNGVVTRAWLFEAVPVGATAPEAPNQPCGLVVDLDLTAADPGPLVIAETTVGERDRVHDPTCDDDHSSIGPERVFSFTLTEARSLRIDLNHDEAAFSLWRGSCAAPERLGCATYEWGDDGLDDRAVAPTVPAGTYLLVVEAHGEDRPGTGFLLDLWLGPPEVCQLEDEDPSDDDPSTARNVERLDWVEDPDLATPEDAGGTLCAGDRDFVIVERWSTASRFWLTDAPRDRTVIVPTIIDDVATLATGEPVYTLGDEQPFDDGATGPGIFYIGVQTTDADLFRHQWHLVHEPATCVPDVVDSLAAVLDDGNNVARRVPLPPAGVIRRCLTSDTDVDVTVVPMVAGLDALVTVDDSYETVAQVYALTSPDAELGAALGHPIPNNGAGAIADGSAPYLAVVTQTPIPAGEPHRITVEMVDMSGPCDEAAPLADSGTLTIDSDLFEAVLDPVNYGDCTGFAEEGPEAVFSLVVGDGDVVEAEVEPTDGGDVSLYLLTSCIYGNPGCLTGRDDYGSGDAESLSYTHSGADRTLFLVADSFSTDAYTATLRWSVTRAGQ